MILYFRQTHEDLKDPKEWPSTRGFTYATTTSNTVLRKHLDRFHKDEYMKHAKEKNWTTMLPSVKMQLSVPGPTSVKPKIMFSPELVLQKLVCFIAVNDQVGILVCPYNHFSES
jgi:hypothetical protein